MLATHQPAVIYSSSPYFQHSNGREEEDSEFKASLAHMATFCLERKKEKKSATIIHINISLHKERKVNDQ